MIWKNELILFMNSQKTNFKKYYAKFNTMQLASAQNELE